MHRFCLIRGEMRPRGFRAIFAAGLMCFALACSACSEDEPVRRVDLSMRADPASHLSKDAITYAYLPQYAHTASYERHRRLVEYITKVTGLPMRQVFPDTFEAHIKMMEQGEIDISFSNPFAYIKMAERGAAKAFASVIETEGEDGFRGQIITRFDNTAIRSIEDCRGKRWIAVDPTSAGGFLFPLGLFYDHGLKRKDFAQIVFAPGPGAMQEKVIMAVYAGKYDIGSIRQGALDRLQGRINLSEIRILAVTPAHPSWMFSARSGLDPDTLDRIAKAMFALKLSNADDAGILLAAGLREIVPAKDADYDSIRALVAKLDQTKEP